jgi:putative ABC transport system permease protein
MAVPIKYNFRNLRVRWVTTILTMLGISALTVVFLFLAAMSQGLESLLTGTGEPLNLIAMRKGATAESQSIVTKRQFEDVAALQGVARDPAGEPMVSPELVVVATFLRVGSEKGSVQLRGVGPRGRDMRRGMKVEAGRWFNPSLGELVVGTGTASRFPWIKPGATMNFRGREWRIVGLFSCAGQAYESEVWGDIDDLKAQFKRDISALLIGCSTPSDLERIRKILPDDKQIQLDALPQIAYFKKQNQAGEMMKAVSGIMGFTLSIGAIFGAANTMYAAVASRTREIATMRVLGFSRLAIWFSFVLESAFIGLLGGIVGALLARLFFNNMASGTVNWQSFSDMAFKFRVTSELMVTAIIMSVIMGVVGGFFPAFRASRMTIARALRGL